jgi:hypothetical protein
MEFLMEYHLAGIMIGVATFLIIGIFHPLVTKGEYYFGVRIWWIFLLMGIAAVIGSVLVENIVWSTLLGRLFVLEYRRIVRTAQAGRKRVVSQAA